MHISEGVLSPEILITGYALASIGTAIGVKKMKQQQIPQVAMLTGVFFIASLIRIPFGISSVHLVLNGLLGVLLGWSVFPAILMALFLQSILFQYGGLTVLGVNTFNMAFPAILAYYLFKYPLNQSKPLWLSISGVGASIIGICIASLFIGLELVFANEAFWTTVKLLWLSHIPVVVVESIIVVISLNFILKVKPSLLSLQKK